MDAQSVIGKLGALAQETRLKIFRELVKCHLPNGEGGVAAGELARSVGISPSALSFHLKEMQWNELISSRRVGRSMIYRANLDAMQDVVTYLLDDCCGGACSVEVVNKTNSET